MFLTELLQKNRPLAEFAFEAHQGGALFPDTYLIDLDAVERNAALLLAAGRENGVKLYFMLKQLGRNPLVAQSLGGMGFGGAVCVDFREALTLSSCGVPLGNVGHLVQTPLHALEQILAARPDIVTVYTVEKAREISDAAGKLGLCQAVMLRVVGRRDSQYPGQQGGFRIEELHEAAERVESLPGVRLAGVCGFPCMAYDGERREIFPTPNADTVLEAARLLEDRGHKGLQINMPSVTCVKSIPLAAKLGATHAEPGHGLSGTTPWHAQPAGGPEIPAIAYLSEVSHRMDGKAFCYGGGYYRRGHLSRALVGKSLSSAALSAAREPDALSIDYHIELEGAGQVSDAVLMCFRTQIFVTRSEVAVVRGLSSGRPRIDGIFSPLGQRLRSA